MLWWKKYFLGIVVDLSKAFDNVDHEILIKGNKSKEDTVKICYPLKVTCQTENNILNINYGNIIAWCITSITKFKKLPSKQKQTLQSQSLP